MEIIEAPRKKETAESELLRTSLGRVRYGEGDPLRQLFNESAHSLDSSEQRNRRQWAEASHNTLKELFRCFAMVKNKGFEEEQEWRLISTALPNTSPSELPIKVEVGRRGITSYIEIPFCLSSVVKIVIGPGGGHDQAQAVEQLLYETFGKKERHPLVTGSKIPFRE